MTPDQRTLLEDKADLWRRASKEGNMEMRDYHRRAAEALDSLLASDRRAQGDGEVER